VVVRTFAARDCLWRAGLPAGPPLGGSGLLRLRGSSGQGHRSQVGLQWDMGNEKWEGEMGKTSGGRWSRFIGSDFGRARSPSAPDLWWDARAACFSLWDGCWPAGALGERALPMRTAVSVN